MTAVRTVAIAGGGVTGLASAIQLARAGISVDLYEAKPEISALGSGITIQGNAIRIFDRLGAWPDIRAKGYPFDGLTLRAPGPGAAVIAELPDVKTGGPEYPATMGMYRPLLASTLLDHAVRSGARVRFGSKVTGIDQHENHVTVAVNGEPAGVYDLLIGADGLHSSVRELIGIDTRPQPTGMGIWRTVLSRPPEVRHSELYYGGPAYIAGYTPTGQDTMYAFLVEKAQDRFALSAREMSAIMLQQSEAYFGPWESIRADIAKGSRVNYTWFTQHLASGAWNRGRVVILGDAAHSCPPTIAQGAAQGLEDAWVLGELLLSRDTVDRGLWDEFHSRRLPRAARVVEASVTIGRWQLDGDRDADAGALISAVAQQMAEPA